tara:strand:- start:4946 stop:5776 length:831 start_codon:yes stop_codon:yes gene_type:complete
MKTIKDAYKELNGVLPGNYTKQEFLFIDTSDDRYLVLHGRHHEEQYQYICTVEEFNNCKPEKPVRDVVMEHKVIDSHKELDMDIDWSTTKYNFSLVHNLKNIVKFLEFKPRLTGDNECYKTSVSSTLFRVGPWSIEERPQPILPTLTYTQAMYDNGVLPSVGHSFRVGNEVESDSRIINFKGLEVEVIGLSKLDDDTVITFSHPTMGIGCGVYFESWVKPLTPPITLIDGECYQFDYHKGTFQGYFKLSTGRLYHSTGYYHESVCTNIQPLILEVK